MTLGNEGGWRRRRVGGIWEGSVKTGRSLIRGWRIFGVPMVGRVTERHGYPDRLFGPGQHVDQRGKYDMYGMPNVMVRGYPVGGGVCKADDMRGENLPWEAYRESGARTAGQSCRRVC